jgi:type II secretory pathway component PulF
MKFKYSAVDESGKTIEGIMEAESGAAVLASLAQKNLRPITVSESESRVWSRIAVFGGGINVTDQIFLTKYLGLMLRSGVNLLRAMDILAADFKKPSVQIFLNEVRESLQRGAPLYSTFAHYPRIFSPVFVNLIKAGEKSGNLDVIFDSLSAALDRERNFRGRVSSALVYPIFILAVAVLVITFLVIFAIPRIAAMFSGSGFEPPAFSRVVFGVSELLSANLLILGIGTLGAFLGGWYFFGYTVAGRGFIRRFLAATPLIRDVYKRISLQRFSETFALLLKSGLPIIEVLKITSGVVSYPGMGGALVRIADEGVSKGVPLGAAFHKELVFPAVVSNLIAISERAGRTDEVLFTLSGFYESEVDISLKKLVSVIEPVLLLVIGGIVGLIALSVILPIYQLVGQF